MARKIRKSFTEWMDEHPEFTGGWDSDSLEYNKMKLDCGTRSDIKIKLCCPECGEEFERSVKHIVYKSVSKRLYEKGKEPEEKKLNRKGEEVNRIIYIAERKTGLDKVYCGECKRTMAKQVRNNHPIVSPQKSFQDWLDDEGKKYGISAVPNPSEPTLPFDKLTVGSNHNANFYCERCDKEHPLTIKSVCYRKKYWSYLPCCTKEFKERKFYGAFTLQDWALIFWGYRLGEKGKAFNGHLVWKYFQDNVTFHEIKQKMCAEKLYKGRASSCLYKCDKRKFMKSSKEITEELTWCNNTKCTECNDEAENEVDECEKTWATEAFWELNINGLNDVIDTLVEGAVKEGKGKQSAIDIIEGILKQKKNGALGSEEDSKEDFKKFYKNYLEIFDKVDERKAKALKDELTSQETLKNWFKCFSTEELEELKEEIEDKTKALTVGEHRKNIVFKILKARQKGMLWTWEAEDFEKEVLIQKGANSSFDMVEGKLIYALARRKKSTMMLLNTILNRSGEITDIGYNEGRDESYEVDKEDEGKQA